MPANAWPTANIGGMTETINAQGELQITGNYKGLAINQVTPTRPPCMVFINPVDRNIIVERDLNNVPLDFELVKVIKTIT